MSSSAIAIDKQATLPDRPASQWAKAWRVLFHDKFALAGAAIILTVCALVLLAPWVSPYDPILTEAANRLAPPLSSSHILGTDELGRDILSRLIYGGRTSLMVAIVPNVISILLGGALGILAGYFGGRWDTIIMRCMDVILAFPSVLLAVGVASALGPSATNLMIALVIVSIPAIARIVRSSVLEVRALEYVSAARAIGSSDRRIITGHILPNILGPIIVFATLETGRKIIMAAGLTFLGLGVEPPTADWGAMLATGRQFMMMAPHVATIPGLVIFLVTISFNMLGDGARDALDPRLRNR